MSKPMQSVVILMMIVLLQAMGSEVTWINDTSSSEPNNVETLTLNTLYRGFSKSSKMTLLQFPLQSAKSSFLYLSSFSCSGNIETYVQYDEYPTRKSYLEKATGDSYQWLNVHWKVGSILYIGVYGLGSGSFNLMALDDPKKAPVENLGDFKVSIYRNNITFDWSGPATIAYYEYQIMYTDYNQKSPDGSPCNFFSYCGLQACNAVVLVPFTSLPAKKGTHNQYQTYISRDNIASPPDPNNVRYSLIVRGVHNNYGVYPSVNEKRKSSVDVWIILCLGIFIAFTMFFFIGSGTAFILYYQWKKTSAQSVAGKVYKVVY